jgi:threonine dehydrogenase-like Zn-dependent dehydrogenase
MIVRFCQYAGARYIFSVDISDKRLSFLPSDSKRIIPVNPKTQDLKKLVSDKTAGRMADIVYEATGNHDLIAEEFDALRVEGRMVIVSSPAKSTLFNFQQLCSRNSYTIIGAHNRSHTPVQTWENPWTQKHDGEFFFELIKNGDIIVRPLVTHRVPYTQAIEMYQMLMSDRSEAMGVLLDWENTEIY